MAGLPPTASQSRLFGVSGLPLPGFAGTPFIHITSPNAFLQMGPMENSSFTHLRKSLQGDLPKPICPAGVRPALFDDGRYTQAHALLVDAYGAGGGRVKSLEDWWFDLRNDPEYSHSIFLLAVDDTDNIVGLAQCWTSAFLKDLVVSEAWRRRGVGEALLLEAFYTFQRRGSVYLDLKVEHRNPSGADRLYRRMGMIPVINLTPPKFRNPT